MDIHNRDVEGFLFITSNIKATLVLKSKYNIIVVPF